MGTHGDLVTSSLPEVHLSHVLSIFEPCWNCHSSKPLRTPELGPCRSFRAFCRICTQRRRQRGAVFNRQSSRQSQRPGFVFRASYPSSNHNPRAPARQIYVACLPSLLCSLLQHLPTHPSAHPISMALSSPYHASIELSFSLVHGLQTSP